MPVFEITAPSGRKFEITAPDGATKEQALEYAKQNMPAPPKATLGPEGMAKSIKEAADEMGPLSNLAIGFAGRVNDAAMRLKQLLGNDLSQQEQQGVRDYRTQRDASTAGLVGSVAADVAGTARLGVGAQNAVARVAGAALPKVVAPAVGAGVVGAAISAGTEPVLPGESTARNALVGAAGGVAGDTAARVLGRVAQPLTRSADVDTLMSKGIVPTPGRAAGANSMMGRLEQSLESLPVVGQFIRDANLRSIEELNRAAVNGSLPNGAQVTVAGRKAIDAAKNIFDNAYTSALAGKSVKIGNSLDNVVATIKSDPDLFLTDAAEKDLVRLVQQVKSRIPASGEISGDLAKKIDSFLGGKAASFTRSQDAAQREFGASILEVQKQFRASLARDIPELKGIDAKYASFLRVLRAAGATGSRAGVFSPEQLQSAVRMMDNSRNRATFARGDALLQDLSEPAVNVLGRTVPDSGTAGRMLTSMLPAAGAASAAGNEYMGGPGYLTALAAAPLLYSRAGARYMLGDYPGQQMISQGLRNIAPYSAQVGRALAIDK